MSHTPTTPMLEILNSSRVSSPTRRAMEQRLAAIPADYKPTCITMEAFAILERVLSRLFPDDEHGAPGANELSLAARLERQRATGRGHGWRYGSLPPDAQALAVGLQKLDWSAQHRHRRHFIDLTEDRADALLHRIQNGEERWEGLDASRWFEEILADATQLYVSHQDTLETMSFNGFADSPNGWPAHTDVRMGVGVGLGKAEAWEPKRKTARR